MTDEQIKKALKYCQDTEGDSCQCCEYLDVPGCQMELSKDALYLINRQQKQLENYSRKVRTMAKDICRYKAKIDRLKDKNLELLNKLLPYEEYPPLENIIEEKESDTEDVVEVVRCKDCKHYKANSCFNRQWDLESSVEIPLVREDDYCSYGERKCDK
jgi:hypothetical protein